MENLFISSKKLSMDKRRWEQPLDVKNEHKGMEKEGVVAKNSSVIIQNVTTQNSAGLFQ